MNNVEFSFEESVEALLNEADIQEDRKLIKQLLATSILLGTDKTERLNLKISAAALAEMRDAYKLFAPYSAVKKVTVFGSARTTLNDPLWKLAHDVAASLASEGWLVVTGAGPGIMEAAASGAGPERALGVSIRLPFEETPNNVVSNSERLVSMKYFFTRKLMLVKESLGFICLPGGFGTMDEVFELLTLQQTGKMVPMPIVLLDQPGGTYWKGFKSFVLNELEAKGYVAEGDLDRVLITDSVEKAVAETKDFWRNYESLRWVNDRLVLRLKTAPDEKQLAKLNEDFGYLLARGEITTTEPLEVEKKEGDAIDKARISLVLEGRMVGELHKLIRALNKLI